MNLDAAVHMMRETVMQLSAALRKAVHPRHHLLVVFEKRGEEQLGMYWDSSAPKEEVVVALRRLLADLEGRIHEPPSKMQ